MLDYHDMQLYEMGTEAFSSFINIRIKKYADQEDEELSADIHKIKKLLIAGVADRNMIKQIEMLMHENKEWFEDPELNAEDFREICILIGDIHVNAKNDEEACEYYEAALKNLERAEKKEKKLYKDDDDSEEMLKEIETKYSKEREEIKAKIKMLEQ